MEHGPGWRRTGWMAAVKIRGGTGVKGSRGEKNSWEDAAYRKYVNIYKECKESHETFFFYTLCLLFGIFFVIDNSKYFPGRQLSVMIWTAASAISTSASWGRIRMETILATSLSLLRSLFPLDGSLCLFHSKSSISPPLLHCSPSELFSLVSCVCVCVRAFTA